MTMNKPSSSTINALFRVFQSAKTFVNSVRGLDESGNLAKSTFAIIHAEKLRRAVDTAEDLLDMDNVDPGDEVQSELAEINALCALVIQKISEIETKARQLSKIERPAFCRIAEDDEIVFGDFFHMERLDSDTICFRIGDKRFALSSDHGEVHLNPYDDGKRDWIVWTAEDGWPDDRGDRA